jgi:hypothetical protein
MAGDALFIGWGAAVRGRGQRALDLFQESVAYWGSLQQDGRIEGFDAVVLQPHGGDLAGFVVLRGERTTLDEIRSSPDFTRLVMRANLLVDGIGVVSAYTGEALGRQMALLAEVVEDL